MSSLGATIAVTPMVRRDPVKHTPSEASDFQSDSDSAEPQIKNMEMATELMMQMTQIIKQKDVTDRTIILPFVPVGWEWALEILSTLNVQQV